MRYWLGEKRTKPLPPANEEHLQMLRQSALEWNTWRGKHPDIIPELNGADLTGQDLSGYNLHGARFEGANLTRAILRRSDLEDAWLFEANLYKAELDESNLANANLEDADLLIAFASKTVFSNIKARGARFSGAVIRDSQLGGSDLRNTDLRESDFHGSDFRQAKFEGAILWTTNLEEADLRGATGMRLDETIIRNSKFSPRSPDRWSTLRRYYTGPRYIITLVLLIGFVLPYIVKSAGWVAAARTQEVVCLALLDVETRIKSLEASGTVGASVASELTRLIIERLPYSGGNNWQAKQVWELLLGIDKGIWFLIATCVLLVYNLLRGMLTLVIGPMRDAEERSGVSPPHRVDGQTRYKKLTLWLQGGWAESYAWLWIPHKIVTVLSVVAIASFLFHTIDWLALVVWLPV